MPSSIVPTIGRKVWLWMPGAYSAQDPAQAFDATIVCVSPDGAQLGDAHGAADTPYATWMPYQMGQAAKKEPS